MPTYLALFSYSDEAMAAMIESPAEREPAVRAVLESVGARLEALYWMFGAHDGIAIVDAPDSLTMAGVSAAIRSTGSIRSETHELFSTADVRHILETARRASRPLRDARSIRVGPGGSWPRAIWFDEDGKIVLESATGGSRPSASALPIGVRGACRIGHHPGVDEPDRRTPDPLAALCHVCGSTQFEYVDDSHIRCTECGHGATFVQMTAVRNPNPSPAALSEAEERMRTLDAQTAAVFAGASFRP